MRSWYHSYRTMADGKPRTVRFAVPQDFGTSDDALPAGVAALPYLTAAPAHRPTSPPFFSRAAGIAALAVMAREQVNSAREVTEYVEKYKLQDILTDAVNEAVTEGTTDPVAYIGRVLLQKAHGSAPKDDTLDFDNLLLCTDSYKTSHWKQYPPGTEYVYSYFESRGGKFDEICFFGLQYFIKRCAAAPPRRRAAPRPPRLTASPRRPLPQVLFKHFYPQERKSQQSLFWFGLGVNIFFGNIIAITQQALWGRSLDYCAVDGGRNINYGAVVRDGLRTDGIAAFFTFPKWATRVLMNAPVQGTLPWFYNQVLPRGEKPFLAVLKPALGVFGYK